MRNIITILLLLTTLGLSAQGWRYTDYRKKARNKTIAVLAIQAGSIILEASGDALLDRGRNEGNQNKMAWGHALQAGSVATLLTLPLVVERKDVLTSFGSYMFLRLGAFNSVYNAVSGNSFGYVGNTDYCDRLQRSLRAEPQGIAIFNGLAIMAGVTIQIKHNF